MWPGSTLRNVFTMLIPATSLLRSDNTIYRFPYQSIGITTDTFCFTEYVVSISSKPCFDGREGLLNRIQIGRVCRKVQQSHSALKKEVKHCSLKSCDHSPFFNHLTDTRNLVNTCIVHNEHRLGQRPRLHPVKYPLNKVTKLFAIKWMV